MAPWCGSGSTARPPRSCSWSCSACATTARRCCWPSRTWAARPARDRKSTRLNSSHLVISYAVFCLKKKKTLDNNRLDLTAFILEQLPEETLCHWLKQVWSLGSSEEGMNPVLTV